MSRAPQNLLVPFRRDRKRDFAAGTGAELLAAKVRQVLLTEGATPHSSGELPWRTSFGAGLARLRHQRNDAVLAELARVYVRDALARWLPGVQLMQLTAVQEGDTLVLRIHVRDGSTSPAQNATLTVLGYSNESNGRAATRSDKTHLSTTRPTVQPV